MMATCIGECFLAVRVALGRASTGISVLQALLIVGFTGILAWHEPTLLVHPYGILAKNLPLLAVIGTAWLIEQEGWSGRAQWLLRGGIASIWIIQGLFPKILLQQPQELAVVANCGPMLGDAGGFLRLLGVGELLSGIAVLLVRGRALQIILGCQIAGLIVLPLLIGLQEPLLWVHPFGPFTKNVPIIAGTVVLIYQSQKARARRRLVVESVGKE